MDFVLKDIICSMCYNVSDINMFRCKLTSENEEDDSKLWICQSCEQPYDMYFIEGKIIQAVRDMITLY